MTKLAIVPKMHDTSYGSQFDINDIKCCIGNIKPKSLNISIIDMNAIYGIDLSKYDAVLFIGLSDYAKSYITTPPKNQKIFIWSNNHYDLVNNPSLFKNVDIRFEQSTNTFPRITGRGHVIYLTTAFQEYSYPLPTEPVKKEYDVVFSGGLNRTSRTIEPLYRVKVLQAIMDAGFTVVNYNARPSSQREIENRYLAQLSSYKTKFTHVDRWANKEDLQTGKFVLNMPFPHLGVNADKNFAMTYFEKECSIWYHTWDIFRSIGADTNIITYAAEPINKLGVSDDQVHYYTKTPQDLQLMTDQIIEIIKSGKVKKLLPSTIQNNSYTNRWGTIIKHIELYMPTKEFKK